MKKILISTDFSDNSYNAADYAIKLFGVKDLEYLLINTYMEPKAVTAVVVSLNDYLRKESLDGLEAHLTSIKSDF